MRTARQKKIIREIQRLHASRLPLNLSAVKRSDPELIEQVYAEQPLWGWKRAVTEAGLDYAKINVELRDYVECEICDWTFAMLASHLIRRRHQVSPQD